MKVEIIDILQWGWGVFIVGFGFWWREIRSIRKIIGDRETIIHDHDKEIAVVKAMNQAQSNQMTEIKASLMRIEEQLSRKADK